MTKSTIWNGSASTDWYKKDENATVFAINTAEELAGLAQLVNDGEGFSDKTILLDSDIALNNTLGWEKWNETTEGLNEWTAIGNGDNQFEGTFDGQGHAVSGVYINKPDDNYQGLFGKVFGEMKNLGVADSYIRGCKSVGGLVGYVNAADSCYSSANVFGKENVGGLVGGEEDMDCLIENSYATGNVSSEDGKNIGGLLGSAEDGPSIKNSYATGDVSGRMHVGGLVGYISSCADISIFNCYATGKATAKIRASGLAGKAIGNYGRTKIANSYYNIESNAQAEKFKGNGKKLKELKFQKTYEGWDFDSIWAIDPKINNGLPHLRKIATEAEALALLKKYPKRFKYLPEELKTAKICLIAVQKDGFALHYVPEAVKTEEICLAAVNECGYMLEYVPKALKTEDICVAAVKQDSRALEYVPEALKTEDMCVAAVKQDSDALEYVPKKLKKKVEKRVEEEKEDDDD
jgi:hypothetical protein